MLSRLQCSLASVSLDVIWLTSSGECRVVRRYDIESCCKSIPYSTLIKHIYEPEPLPDSPVVQIQAYCSTWSICRDVLIELSFCLRAGDLKEKCQADHEWSLTLTENYLHVSASADDRSMEISYLHPSSLTNGY
jgi:hypothetical protein